MTDQVDGAEYQALVAAMQLALVRVGVEVAEGIAAAAELAKAPRPGSRPNRCRLRPRHAGGRATSR